MITALIKCQSVYYIVPDSYVVVEFETLPRVGEKVILPVLTRQALDTNGDTINVDLTVKQVFHYPDTVSEKYIVETTGDTQRTVLVVS